MRKFLVVALCAAAILGVLAPGTARAEPFRFVCYVLHEAGFVNCPEGNSERVVHRAWMYGGMFRDRVVPQGLNPGDALWCGVDAKHDLADCVVLDRK